MRFRLVLATLFAACHRDPVPPPALEIAEPSAVPPGAERIACRIGPKQSMLAFDNAGLHLRFITLHGNTVSMFGRDVVVAAGDGGADDVTLEGALASFADGHAGTEWIDAAAKVSSPDGQSATVKVSLHIDKLMAKRLDAVRTGAVLFPGETPAASSANKIVWVHPGHGAPYVLGEGRWRDIDSFAFESVADGLGKACGTDPEAAGFVTIMSGHAVSHVELYDRRAGKRIDETTIDGPQLCPNERDAATPPSSNDAAVRAWIASKVAR